MYINNRFNLVNYDAINPFLVLTTLLNSGDLKISVNMHSKVIRNQPFGVTNNSDPVQDLLSDRKRALPAESKRSIKLTSELEFVNTSFLGAASEVLSSLSIIKWLSLLLDLAQI